METRCDPSLMLQQPARFRHVCPLLKAGPDGRWRCSVDTPEVRPFWGRAFATFGLALLLIYLTGTLAAWALLRSRGYPIAYAEVTWPPAWSRFHLVQSRFFASKANRALAKNDVQEALMSLSVAYQLDRQNYALGRLFAQLTQAAQPALSDRVYAQLAHDHAERRPETFAAWYEALLWRADFGSIKALAREALTSDTNRSSAWLNALLFALRREPDEVLVKELASAKESAVANAVFSLELQTRGPASVARAALLSAPPQGAPEYLSYYRPKRLIELGFGQDALAMLDRSTAALPARDQLLLHLEAYTALGWRSLIRNDVEALIGRPFNAVGAELLASYLIRHPDEELLRLAFDAFKALPLTQEETTYRTWTSWLCAAGANRDFGRFREAAEQMKKISGADYRALKQVEAFFRGESASARIESYLPAMQPIPIEITYALLERYYQPRAPTPAKAAR